MSTETRRPALVALILVMGVGPFATDTYLAALPELQDSLATTATVVQLTLTTFIVGMAAGQLLIGPLSDSYGRRRLLLAGAIVFTVLSVVCAVSPNGPMLVAARLIQGLVAGGGVAIGRAVVTDVFHGPRAAATFGVITSFTFLGPVLAPAVGGLILAYGTWRTVFAALAGLGLLMVIGVAAGIPETLPPRDRHPAGLRPLLGRMGGLARDWAFMRHVVLQCVAGAGFFTYIGGSAFVLRSVYDISPARYTVVFATNAAAMAVASLMFRFLVVRTGAAPLRAVGVTLSTVGAGGLLAVALTGPSALPLAAAWAMLCLVVAGMGLTIPSTTALAQEAGRRSAGTASALQGGLTFITAALVTPLTGIFGHDTLLPMALAMSLFFTAAFILMCFVTRTRTPAPV
ncbi:multidrug effflux MFS transporter [Actinoplanes couchii]|uniref:Bcr/CflA family drug resistance efflux transporter n=1 Tax=Actinoplanes couchii TaxID=403638 RepID=A0ABQ3XMD9_9ACTN|nr:multidrug effflux MFS transporter [Actinoplanes couchii]MDR6321570.1 DHA1 family bicyclomycin/chloramphenicol resistance-like MFS transporter [Actinoplanes couchii]GID59666.1 Bcr/CflA family drug resistance efflux transporter [Actinoplanes couchii]